MVVTEDPYALAVAAAEELARVTGVGHHDVAVVLGSGWGPAVDDLGETVGELPITELPGFPAPTAVGHTGSIRSIVAGDGGPRVLALSGRVHLYEGHSPATVV
ncbi:MAG TPA: hypothetical protein VGO78_21635, partial [Acidimicrobiales bacterium]|nr:hypothetical protein [Acidimicrobiales bacterium]